MKKSLLFALCLGLATITAAAQRNYSQVVSGSAFIPCIIQKKQ